MTTTNVEPSLPDGNLLLPVPAVILADLVSEELGLGSRYPEIPRRIGEDQDRAGMAKKQLCCERQAWLARQMPSPPVLEKDLPGLAAASSLVKGQCRMDPERVLMFLVVSHHFQSVYSRAVAGRLDGLEYVCRAAWRRAAPLAQNPLRTADRARSHRASFRHPLGEQGDRPGSR